MTRVYASLQSEDRRSHTGTRCAGRGAGTTIDVTMGNGRFETHLGGEGIVGDASALISHSNEGSPFRGSATRPVAPTEASDHAVRRRRSEPKELLKVHADRARRRSARDACARLRAFGRPSSGARRAPVVAATTTSVAWSWEPDDTAASYRLYKNGRFVASTTPWEFTLDGLECGLSYVLGVEAVDANGRRSPRASVIVASAPCTPLKVTPPIATPEPTPEQHLAMPAAESMPSPANRRHRPRSPSPQRLPARDDHSSCRRRASGRPPAPSCGTRMRSIPRFSAAS